MELKNQVDFYNKFFQDKRAYPVEKLKQSSRIYSLVNLARDCDKDQSLVVGCGAGEELIVLETADNLTALDLSFVGVQKARAFHQEANYLQADGINLPFDDNTFDVLLCSEVIEHVYDPSKLIKEFARVLKPGGILLLSTPNWISWWGLARKLGEWILRRPVASGGQPIDNWFTAQQLEQTLKPYFSIEQHHGVWYFPPTGLGDHRLPDSLIAPIMKLMLPFDRRLGVAIPKLGHIHLVKAVLNDRQEDNK